MSLSLLYGCRTEAPRPDGKAGRRGCGCAAMSWALKTALRQYPYVREARRIKQSPRSRAALRQRRARSAATGVPAASATALEYPIRSGSELPHRPPPDRAGDKYIERRVAALSDPRWAPCCPCGWKPHPGVQEHRHDARHQRVLRLHPVEWNIGEVAGALAAFAAAAQGAAARGRETPALLADFQKRLIDQGVELRWPRSWNRRESACERANGAVECPASRTAPAATPSKEPA